ncbi:hypothetical protein TNCV_1429131 [Trichonephila clavipes]|nr:hypothetical protein TNCV_1429131 [Trichonephila clavipes]
MCNAQKLNGFVGKPSGVVEHLDYVSSIIAYMVDKGLSSTMNRNNRHIKHRKEQKQRILPYLKCSLMFKFYGDGKVIEQPHKQKATEKTTKNIWTEKAKERTQKSTPPQQRPTYASAVATSPSKTNTYDVKSIMQQTALMMTQWETMIASLHENK